MDRGRQFFFTQPVVRDRGGDLGKTWYVSVEWAFEGDELKRERVYSGKDWGVVGRGNRAGTLKERRAYFARVAEVLAGMLRRGDNPFVPAAPTTLPVKIGEGLALALAERARHVEVETYGVLTTMVRRALAHWPASTLVKSVTTNEVRDFLNKLPGGNTTFNRNWRDMHRLWATMIDLGLTTGNPVRDVAKRKSKPKSHEGYSVEQVPQLFEALEAKGRNLYLCARLMFHAFLRPHRECRLLQRKHIDFDRGIISVPASIRKGADAFILPLHPDLRKALEGLGVHLLAPNDYVIHLDDSGRPVGPDYFKVLWKRIKPEMLKAGTIRKEQTLYSIRHTAACLHYINTKDVEELQRLMSHADLQTTLIYLRSIGMYTKPIEVGNLPSIKPAR